MALLNISPYNLLKGPATNSVAPSYSRPNLTAAGPNFKAQPIKHWRKQLIPTTNSGGRNRRAGMGMPMDLPGGSVYLGDVPANTTCLLNATEDAVGLSEDILRVQTDYCPSGTTCFYDSSHNRMSRHPDLRRFKPATTLISKEYYSDRKSYLRSRGNLYDQKLTALPVPGVTYLDAAGELLYPSSTNTTRQSQDCTTTCAMYKSSTTIYKPNNKQYAKQGAVDSSDRLTRLKLNTVNKNAASYQAIFGTSASRYLGMASTPYFIKSKYQPIYTPPTVVPPYSRLDLTFNEISPGVNGYGLGGPIYYQGIAVQADDKIVVGSYSFTYNSTECAGIIRLTAAGLPDPDFTSLGFSAPANSVELYPDQRILVTGIFDFYNYFDPVNGIPCPGIARLNYDGTFDTTFNNIGSGFDMTSGFGPAYTTALHTGGRILVGGAFETYNGAPALYFIALNEDGSPDTTFNTNFTNNFTLDDVVGSIKVQADNTILIGGTFSVGNGLIRLLADGLPDPTFGQINYLVPPSILTIAIQDDQYILIGGSLSYTNGVNTSNNIARLNILDGSLDTTFQVVEGFDQPVNSIVVEPGVDGKIVVGGEFQNYNSGNPTTSFMARLNPDGSFDSSFAVGTNFNDRIFSMALQSSGNIIVGGVFSAYGATPVGGIARIKA